MSHDRYFINKLSTRILEFGENGIFDYPGSYYGFKPKSSGASGLQPENKPSAAKLERLTAKEERLRAINLEMLSEEASSDHIRLSRLHRRTVLPGRQSEPVV